MKWLSLILGGIVVLGLLALGGLAAWVAWFLDADAYRPRLVEQVRHYTGRELNLDGELSIDLLPRIALSAQSASLAARPGFGEAPMIAADGVDVVMQAWPLLRGELRVDHVVLESLQLSLGVDAAGESAWGDIVERVTAATGLGAGAGDGQALGAGMVALAVQGVEVRDGSMSWRDGRDGVVHEITGLSVAVDRVRSGEPGRFDLAARIESPRLPAPVHLVAGGRLRADFDTVDVDFSDLAVKLSTETLEAALSVESIGVRDVRRDARVAIRGTALSAARGDASLGLQVPDAVYSRADDRLEIPAWRLDGTGLSAHGDAEVSSLTAVPATALHLRTTRLDAAALLNSLGVTDRLSGRGELLAALAARGADADAIARSLRGDLELILADGAMHGIDIGRILAAARGASGSEAASPPAGEPATRFSRLEAALRFEDGVGTSRELSLVADGFRVAGEGAVDLTANVLDCRLAVYIARPPAAAGADVVYEPAPVPLRISGDLDQPGIELDVEALMRAQSGR